MLSCLDKNELIDLDDNNPNLVDFIGLTFGDYAFNDWLWD